MCTEAEGSGYVRKIGKEGLKRAREKQAITDEAQRADSIRTNQLLRAGQRPGCAVHAWRVAEWLSVEASTSGLVRHAALHRSGSAGAWRYRDVTESRPLCD